jgi:hypothetical protein
MYCGAKLNLCIIERSLKVHLKYEKEILLTLENADIIEQKKLNLTQQETYILRIKEKQLDNTTSSYRYVICQSVYKLIMYQTASPYQEIMSSEDI